LKPFIGFLTIRKQKKITFLFSLDVAATTLTSWHLMVTFCTLHAAQRLNLFESKSIEMKPVMLFGILNGVSIGLLNLSLGFNSIGFYQVNLNSTFTSKSVRQVDTVFFFLFSFTRSWSWRCFLLLLLLYIADDQTCNHTIHCPIGNSVPEEAIQVTTVLHIFI